MQPDDDDRRKRSRWASRDPWWSGPVTYGLGAAATLLLAAAIIGLVMEELWLALVAVAVVALVAFALWAFVTGESWWDS